MSTQSSDYIEYNGEEYAIVSAEPSGRIFDPQQFGIATTMLHTACLRGFQCTYKIAGGEFFLASLKILAKGGLYPPINDTPPSFPSGYVKGHELPASYDDIGLRLPYTGTLRLGRDQDFNFAVPMFRPEAWMYRCVLDVTLQHGHVRSASDVSDEMAMLREQQPESATVKGEYERTRTAIANLSKRFPKPK